MESGFHECKVLFIRKAKDEYGIFFENIMVLFIKNRFMKNKKLKSGIQALLMSGLVIFFIACNSGDYTKNSANGSDTSANTDTAMKNSPGNTDTTNTSTSGQKQMAASKKKGKITVGTMAAKKTSSMKPDKNGIYEMTEVSPAFPGGQSALEDYVNNHIEYPQTALDNSSEGTADVQFVIDENGKVTDAKVIGNKLGNGLDDEAVKVVSNMPDWTPGKVKGKNVKTKIVLPITYKMEE
jgi:TonB family protein